jgi:hypothetical protein
VVERRRAVAVARHLREFEELSIARIVERPGRSPDTMKACFYDPKREEARAVKARHPGVCRSRGAYAQPSTARATRTRLAGHALGRGPVDGPKPAGLPVSGKGSHPDALYVAALVAGRNQLCSDSSVATTRPGSISLLGTRGVAAV